MLLASFSWEAPLYLAVGAAVGCGFCFWKWKSRRQDLAAEERAILDGARREADAVLREARVGATEESLKLREQAETAMTSRRREIDDLERRLADREGLINRQLEGLVQQEAALRRREQALGSRESEVKKEHEALENSTRFCREELHRISKLSPAEARSQLLKEVEREAVRDAGDLTRHILEEARLKAEDQARRIISLAIQRYAGEHTFETTTATVALQGDDIKGRIIGREGRNIRAFESATGVTVLIDDTPNAVVLSGFDPVRREIAREAMHRLILDGRIHPTRIEEVVAKVSQEMDEAIMRAGEAAVLKLGLPPLHVEIVRLLGRLKFRRSFTQNILDHSVEVAQLTGLMAAELGLDPAPARRAGLLHDLGKAIDHEVEGTHAIIGAEFIKCYGETDEVVNGVASHHDEVPHTTVLGILVSAADAISASRPGARSETMTTYLKRLEDLERIGVSFPGVDKCFAVQAGRELRVVVRPEEIGDEQAFALARNIARKIEEGLHYPGQIRITVVRETRCIEFAK